MRPTRDQVMTYGNLVYPWDDPAGVTVERSGGPERVVTDKPDPAFVRRPIGFTADLEASRAQIELGDAGLDILTRPAPEVTSRGRRERR